MSNPAVDLSGAERREHPREAANDPVKVVTAGGHVVDARVVDRSLRGLRLQLADSGALHGDVTVLYPAQGKVYQARIAWRTAPYAGLAVQRAVDMRTATGADTAPLRKLWREHIVS